MGSNYERELKSILHGDVSAIEKITKSLDQIIKMSYEKVISKPFLVLRAAGSLGCDLVALRHDVAFPIEVKSSIERKFMFSAQSGRPALQAKQFALDCSRAGLMPIYAFRLKNAGEDPWRIFTLPNISVDGRLRIVYSKIPQICTTKSGNYIMAWENGMPLHKFLDFIC